MLLLRNPTLVKRIVIISIGVLVVGILALIIGISCANHKEVAAFTIESDSCVKLTLNKKDKIIEASALNDEGEKVLKSISLKRKKLEPAICSLIEEMGKSSYISGGENSLLITVYTENSAHTQKLLDQIIGYVNTFTKNKISLSIISQELETDNKIKNLAQTQNITEGKAQFIYNIINTYSAYTPEELSALSINELNLLTYSDSKTLEKVSVSSKPSDSKFAGRYLALERAFSYLETTADEINNLSITIDLNQSTLVYKIIFNYKNTEFNILVNASTAEIVNREEIDALLETVKANETVSETPKTESESPANNENGQNSGEDLEYDPANPGNTSNIPKDTLTPSDKTPTLLKEDAINIAYKASGLKVSKLKLIDANFMELNGVPCWVINFKDSSVKCKYIIKDADGSVLSFEKNRI